jgi:signal peptidase I, bacterial type
VKENTQTFVDRTHDKPVKKKSNVREYTEALVTAVLIAFVLRAFVVEAFKIPSKSMVPTLMVGDHIFVNKFTYGIRVPFTKKWVTQYKTPKRGEVVVFMFPGNEGLDFIKRVVGVPGDHIKFVGDDLYINNQKIQNVPVQVEGQNPKDKRELLIQSVSGFPDAQDYTDLPYSPEWKDYSYFLERLGEHTHYKQESGLHFRDGQEVVVPEGMLFVMGDNRDNSSDSREWGFVPLVNLKGRAMFIWLSWDHDQGGVRWDRFGKWIK